MTRACKLTLKFATARKRAAIAALLQSYRAAVNFYIRSLWEEPGKLDAKTLERLTGTRLSKRYQSSALKQAMDIVVAVKKTAKTAHKKAGRPTFRGSAILDAKFVVISEGKGIFDLVLSLSYLKSGRRLLIPTKRTAVLNKWLSRPQAKLIRGCALSERGMVLWVELPDLEPKKIGKVLAVDVGVNKLLSDSDGEHYGTDFKTIRDKILRRTPGSKGRQRAYRARANFINRTVNQLPWKHLRAIGHEELTGMKHGKRKGRSKAFRRAIAPWTYRLVLTRIDQKAQENRVRPVSYDPRNTSRECPECGWCEKVNRKGEHFSCANCDHAEDADTVGARNGLARTLAILGSVESPRLSKI